MCRCRLPAKFPHIAAVLVRSALSAYSIHTSATTAGLAERPHTVQSKTQLQCRGRWDSLRFVHSVVYGELKTGADVKKLSRSASPRFSFTITLPWTNPLKAAVLYLCTWRIWVCECTQMFQGPVGGMLSGYQASWIWGLLLTNSDKNNRNAGGTVKGVCAASGSSSK